MSAPDPKFFTSSILPVRERLVLKGGAWQRVPLRVRIGYFYHETLGHTLIDTGYGTPVMRPEMPDFRLALYRLLLRPTLVNDNPIESGLARLGLTKSDINTVLITHFHADHIGGLKGLPNARFICAKSAWDALQFNSPNKNALEGVFPSLLPSDFASRVTFFDDAARIDLPNECGQGFDLAGDSSVVAVDLPGHLAGHMGVYFPILAQPLLYATDTQWLVQAIAEARPPGLPLSRIAHDRRSATQSMEKVRCFMEAGADVVLCHDPHIHARDIDGEVGR